MATVTEENGAAPQHLGHLTTHAISRVDGENQDVVDATTDTESANQSLDKVAVTADIAGEAQPETRPPKKLWYKRLNPLKRREKPPVPDHRAVSKEYQAGFFSLLIFQWMSPLMSVGYRRPLEANDIWLVNPDRGTALLAGKLKASFDKHVSLGAKRPLIIAMYETFKADFLIGGLCSFIGSVVQVMIPFVLKYLIAFASTAYVSQLTGALAPNIGHGLGLVIGMTCMQIVQSLTSNHFFYRGMLLGGQIRSALISIIFDKALTISGRAKAGGKALDALPIGITPGSEEEKEWMRKKLTKGDKSDTPEGQASKENTDEISDEGQGWSNGRIINLMSIDTYRVDHACGFFHMLWTAPITIFVTLALLIINLTYSALAGFALFVITMPLVGYSMSTLMARRKKINKITDQRVSLIQEILQAVRFVKFYGWERSFINRIASIRHREIRSIQILLAIRNGILAIAVALPIFAAMLAFITYSLTHHVLDPAPIFSSLTLFNLLRMPLMFMPLVLGQVTDALASIKRIEAFLLAEDQSDQIEWNPDSTAAVEVRQADFTWERNRTIDPTDEGKKPNGKESSAQKKAKKDAKRDLKKAAKKAEKGSNKADSAPDVSAKPTEPQAPFSINGIDVTFRRNEFVAVIGSVGSGKSSLLAAIAGDMRQTAGSMTIGASRAFCPQQAWIQNVTVQENITFGKPFDRAWYDQVVNVCGLRPDLEMLPAGSLTEIGERGINLSGGQKQRVNIARAIYSKADLLLLDDPLSAVDAHVGQRIMDYAICGVLKDKCRILATHQLHVLNRCDRIILMNEGCIEAIDTFQNLMAQNEHFQSLMAAVETQQEEKVDVKQAEEAEAKPTKELDENSDNALMQLEDRAVKSVSWDVYIAYVKASGSILVFPLLLLILAISQGSNILTNLWLAWWTSNQYGLSQGTYIGIYVSLGILQALITFIFSASLSVFGTQASKVMLDRAIQRVLRAPMSFFDTTPLGRIINRFSKDVDVMDNTLTDSLRMATMTLASLLSVFILIIVYYHYFAIALGPLFLVYLFSASYYRASARELKRHESVLRSVVFARFGESVHGSSTLRAYRLEKQFSKVLTEAVDDMDGAYYLTFSNQRWLGFRLDAIGVMVIFITGVLVVTSRFDVPPSIAGLVLSYILAVVQILQFTVRQVAEVENNMNATERVHHYGSELEEEAPEHVVDIRKTWPESGNIKFENVQMRYRDGLPLVLQDFTLNVEAGERMAIVGRTGAGKSSLMSTLFRLVELSGGSIAIDDINISKIGLTDLRSRLSIIPQDPTLFRGTVRFNLDPFNHHTDAELWEALRQADLIDIDVSIDDHSTRMNLETAVEEEGLNFSLGQRQLMALARALVRGSKIIICDEATSSVDFETDRKIQKTMLEGFKGKTLLCIAHRLKTIIGYDRVCVLDQGRVVELGTPLALFDANGLFRGMCEKNSITRQEVIEAGGDSL